MLIIRGYDYSRRLLNRKIAPRFVVMGLYDAERNSMHHLITLRVSNAGMRGLLLYLFDRGGIIRSISNEDHTPIVLKIKKKNILLFREKVMKQILPLLIVTSLFLTSCTNLGVMEGRKGQVGAATGAATGAIIGQAIGHDTESTLIGTAVGGLLGYIVGNEMDKYDQRQLNHVYERGASGQPSAWVNPDSGNRYSVTPQPAYSQPQTNRVCREAEIVAVINGEMQKTYTTACRDQYGRWKLQN